MGRAEEQHRVFWTPPLGYSGTLDQQPWLPLICQPEAVNARIAHEGLGRFKSSTPERQ